MPAITYPFVEALVAGRSRLGSRTLDVGCGAGQYRAAARGSYVGIDLLDMHYGVAPNVFADAERLPFAHGSFDLVFGVASFFLVPDALSGFTECRRVLREDGSLLVIGYQRHVAKRQQERSAMHRHPWSFEELRGELLRAGFREVLEHMVANHVSPDQPLVRKLLHHLRADARGRRLWLVVEARP